MSWSKNVMGHARAAWMGWKKRWQQKLDELRKKETVHLLSQKELSIRERLQLKLAGIRVIEKRVPGEKADPPRVRVQEKSMGEKKLPERVVEKIVEKTAEYSPAYLEKIENEISEKVTALLQTTPPVIAVVPAGSPELNEESMQDKLNVIQQQIEQVNNLLKENEINFYKRRISEKEFKDRFYNLKLELGNLTAEKKVWEEKLKKVRGNRTEIKQRVPAKFSSEKVSPEMAPVCVNSAPVIARELSAAQETTKVERPLKRANEPVKGILKEVQKHKIFTDIDRMLAFIQERGRVPQTEILEALKIQKSLIEEYAELLQENGFIKIIYTLTGKQEYESKEYEEKKRENTGKRNKKSK